MELEGGCRVSGLREGEPLERGGLRIWRHAGRATGTQAISLRVLEVSGGASPGLLNRGCDEVLFVAEGRGALFLDGRHYDVASGTGAYARPGSVITLRPARGTSLVVISSQCPDPDREPELVEALTTPRYGEPAVAPLARLDDQEAATTADRWYRVLVDRRQGSERVTQFVGGIPPGRAPDHFHHYEEVLCILHGAGRMWSGETAAPIEAGSCVFLPRKQVHCVENTGGGELRLVGVFYPAGSPAVRYDA